MAALDDIIGCIIFFTTVAMVVGTLSAGSLPAYMIALVVILQLIIGAVTGITVSVLKNPAPECAEIIQGTIAAAAVINEIIAAIMAKKGQPVQERPGFSGAVQNYPSDCG